MSGEIVWELTHGTGRDRQRVAAGKTREEAEVVLKYFTQQLALHGRAPDDDSVSAVLGQYLSYLRTNRRGSTFRRYARVLRTFCECFLPMFHPEVQRMRQLRPLHIEEYKQKRAEGGILEAETPEADNRETQLRQELTLGVRAATRKDNARFGWLGRKRLKTAVTPRTVNYELQVLRTFFHWAVRHNHLVIDPATNIERYRIAKRALPKFLTSDQLRRLFEACSGQERRLFMTILLTGMRRGEAVYLRWSDVNFDLGVIFIQEKPDWNWKPKTDERLIPISPILREILQEQYAQRKDDGFVFPNRQGNPDIHVLPKLKRICKKAGIKLATVHSLRHSFGAHLRMAGVSLADIADLLGHKDLATTSIYAKVHQEHLRAAVSKLTAVVTSDGESHASTDVATLPKLLKN